MADDLPLPPSPPVAEPPPARRRVYEPTLLPPRKRRRFSRWLVLPILLVIFGGGFAVLQSRQRARRFVPTVGKIVYASDSGIGPRLWLAQSDGGRAQVLLPSMAASDPAFSPDGAQIAFVSPDKAGASQVWVTDADGQNPVQVTRSGGAKSAPAFAPTADTRLAFLDGGALSTVDLASGDMRRLLPAPVQQAHPTSSEDVAPAPSSVTVLGFRWQPAKDSSEQGLAAMEDRSGVETLALLPTWSGKAIETVNDQDGGPPLAVADTLSLAWAPDGGLLAVAMLGVQEAPLSLLALYDKQGHPLPHPPVAIKSRSLGPQNPVFAPDGATLVFERWRQPTLADRACLGLFAVPVDGSASAHPLYKGEAADAHCLADGQTVLFRARRKDGGYDLERVHLDGTGLTRLSDGKANVLGITVSPQSAPEN